MYVYRWRLVSSSQQATETGETTTRTAADMASKATARRWRRWARGRGNGTLFIYLSPFTYPHPPFFTAALLVPRLSVLYIWRIVFVALCIVYSLSLFPLLYCAHKTLPGPLVSFLFLCLKEVSGGPCPVLPSGLFSFIPFRRALFL
jgi:hypothetical protein